MPSTSRVAAARFHPAGAAFDGPGGRAVSDFLEAHAGGDFAVVEIERSSTRFSLIINPEWVRLAQTLSDTRQDLVEGLQLPRNILLAVVDGWTSDWSEATADLAVEHSADGIPHLRLISLRSNETSASSVDVDESLRGS